MILSRRQLLASLGFALPATAAIVPPAKASTLLHHHRHKGARHGHSLLASRRRHRPAAPTLNQS